MRISDWSSDVCSSDLSACSLGSAQDNPASQYTIERVTFVMRHGIRPPTKAPAIPEGYAADPWPEWPVVIGLLPRRGAQGVGLLGAADGARAVEPGVVPAPGAPPPRGAPPGRHG